MIEHIEKNETSKIVSVKKFLALAVINVVTWAVLVGYLLVLFKGKELLKKLSGNLKLRAEYNRELIFYRRKGAPANGSTLLNSSIASLV